MKKVLLLLSFAALPVFSFAGGVCNNIFAVVSPDGQHLYFSSDRHGSNYEIYSSDLDGVTNLVRLTNTTVNNFYPSVSPDGSKIIFQREDYGAGAEIFIMNSNGSGQTNLTNNSVYDGFPNFSPDGQKIVFDGWDADAYPEIFTMDVNGTNRVQLTNVAGAYWQCSPIYNPSGTYIYFSLGYNADNHLARMDLNGSNIVDITPPNSFGYMEFGMRFSPDQTHLIFSTTEWAGYNNGSDVVISDTLGGNWNRITNAISGEWFHSPFWNPTNNKIYYSYYSNLYPAWQIYEMTSTASSMLILTDCLNSGVVENGSSLNLIQVFPVPAENELNFVMPKNVSAELYDATGRILLTTSEQKINIENLERGFYTIRFVNLDGGLIQISKIIKN